MKSTILRNIGTLVSGNLEKPVLEADALLIEEGKIVRIGAESTLSPRSDPLIIDAVGSTVTPGLIDSHVHPVAGDFTPRQRTLDFIDSALQGGVTRHCQVNGTKPRFSPKRQESYDSSTGARHLSPISKCPGSEESVMSGLQMMTTDSEQVLNGTVD